MKKSAAVHSPIVPGKYFVFVERVVQEQYQTLVVDAASEDEARDKALEQFFSGAVAYMSCTQIEPATARVRPMREKHLRRTGQPDGDGEPEFRTSDRFQGEDEELLQPLGQFPGTRPAAVTRAQARLLCQNFDASGHSNHSGRGATLWVILEHCAQADIPYNLRALPGLGYYVERSKAVADGLSLRMSVETQYGLPSA
ncbi:MAG: hypothetical protein JNM97_11990 [Rhodoferax sp.]|jgi:hypothetical protein|nr:hypothetical protein [Rhodoferax sp.]